MTDPTDGKVFPITVATNAVGTPIHTGVGPHPFSITITPDGKTAYVGYALAVGGARTTIGVPGQRRTPPGGDLLLG